MGGTQPIVKTQEKVAAIFGAYNEDLRFNTCY